MQQIRKHLPMMEKLLFPGFLFLFEVVFLVLFGLLVEYDERGAPHPPLEPAEHDDPARLIRELQSSLGTTKVYPCELLVCFS